jgi:hypothetical protein
MSEKVACHVALCDACAVSMAQAEEESAIAFSALEQEFNTLVPTRRLWTKINDSIERERKPFWKSIAAFLTNPSSVAFASVLFIVAISAVLLTVKQDAPIDFVAQNTENKQIKVETVLTKNELPVNLSPQPIAPPSVNSETISSPRKIQERNDFRIERASYVKSESAPRTRSAENAAPKQPDVVNPSLSANLADEDSYIKTIAALEKTVGNRKDEILSSSARFAFERDMAVNDDAIKKMKEEVGKNPRNETAKKILRASYQNKIDLLNAVVEKNELMAGLK